jgi:pyridoxamine 5'-phosphate oxidase
MHNLAEIRKEYSKATLDITNVSNDPIAQFNKWFDEAIKAKVLEPNAMSLATVSNDHRPSCRIVLLKGIEENKFLFYTNYQSHKGKELENNPVCALTFFWPELERQIRIEGIAGRVSENKSIEYFQSRPLDSPIIQNRIILEDRVKQIEKKFEGNKVLPKPHQWGGYEVDPLLIEFWQGRQSRLHDRLEYIKVDGSWKAHRLAP